MEAFEFMLLVVKAIYVDLTANIPAVVQAAIVAFAVGVPGGLATKRFAEWFGTFARSTSAAEQTE